MVRRYGPIRHGVHPNTAFGLSFALDYARASGDLELAESITSAALRYYLADRACPLGWEPSGADFLSPCLEEAALMARVLETDQYLPWLKDFLPGLFTADDLVPANVSDRSDPQIVHLTDELPVLIFVSPSYEDILHACMEWPKGMGRGGGVPIPLQISVDVYPDP